MLQQALGNIRPGGAETEPGTHQQESAILAIGGLETKPTWENNAWVPRQKMRITMSCDHRVIDGAVGAKFLQTLAQLLENPLRMMW